METGLIAILIPAPLALFLGAMVWLVAFMLRRNRSQDQLTRLGSHYFTGQPEVVIQLAQWQVATADIRGLANRRGYAEVAQPNPAVAVFRPAPSGQHPAVSRTTPSRKQVGKREKLSAELASKTFVWMELAEIGGTIDDEVAVFAGAHGASITRIFGDRLSPTLLLSKVPITTVADTLRDARTPRLTSIARHWTSAGLAIGAFLVSGLVLGAAQGLGLPKPLSFALLGLPIAMFICAIALPLIPAFGSTTARMRRLINEFNGRPRVTILTQQYVLDRLVFGDVAAELGYSFMGSQNSWMTNSRWNKSWITFLKNPDQQHRPNTTHQAWEQR